MEIRRRPPTMDDLMLRLAAYREERGYDELMEIFRQIASGERRTGTLSPSTEILACQIAFIVMRELTLPPE